MSELEKVEREFRSLQTRLIYNEFEGGKIDPADEKRLNELADRRVELSAPRFALAS